MSDPRPCPGCGALLPTGVLDGLCPACLLQQAARGDSVSHAAAPFVAPSLEEVARMFPQLEILSLLGKGGMGAVYQARQTSLERFVALKILAPQNADGEGFAERFNREARALARLSHPSIVAVHEFGKTNGFHYFIMEYVDGVNLRQLQKAGQLSPREALQIVPQICDALQYAHDEGVVHRDIKPENILIDRKGRVKIADFGLAKVLGADAEALRLTAEGHIMGTPHYMAPEQVEHPLAVDHRADIYSLGVVFYEMLTGELPLGKFGPPSTRMGSLHIDLRLDQVVLRALEKQPELRFQQVSEVKSGVQNIAEPFPAEKRRIPWLRDVIFGVALILVVFAALVIGGKGVGGIIFIGSLAIILWAAWRQTPQRLPQSAGSPPKSGFPPSLVRLARVALVVLLGLFILFVISLAIPAIQKSRAEKMARETQRQSAAEVPLTRGSIELVSISGKTADGKPASWRADGDSAVEGPFETDYFDLHPDPRELPRNFVFRVEGLPADDLTWSNDCWGRWCSVTPKLHGHEALDFRMLMMGLLPTYYPATEESPRRTVTIKAGAGLGPWETVITGRGYLFPHEWGPWSLTGERKNARWSVSATLKPSANSRDDKTEIDLAYTITPPPEKQEAVRLIVIDEKGKEIAGEGSGIMGGGVVGEVYTRKTVFRGLPPNQSIELRFQVGPFAWKTFPNLPLYPNPSKTAADSPAPEK